MTITRSDIHNHVILPALGAEFDSATVDAIEDAILDAAPLDTWSWTGTDYESAVLDTDAFWGIVERTAESR